MKKIYMKLFAVLFTGLIGISANAQGVWLADSSQAAIARSTEIPMGITGLTCMHSDEATITGHGDTSAVTIEYNDVTYDNKGFLQGSTNGMFYAFRIAEDGTLDISVKMSANKRTFIIELTTDCPDNADLAALTTNFPTADGITATAAYFTTPTVYDTYSESENTWDGSVVATTETAFLVFSWPVSANKTYVCGCFGSKMMMRGVNYQTTATGLDDFNAVQVPEIFPNPATGYVVIKMNRSAEIGIYNTVGLLVKQQLVTPSNNNVDISGLASGVYFIRDLNGNIKTQKLIVK